MIYHIMTSNVYTDRYIQFIRRNQECIVGEHLFVYSTQKPSVYFDKVDCCYKTSLSELLKLFLFSREKDRFILHGYMHPWLYLVCFLTFWNLKKVSWIIWGGDLHFYSSYKQKLKYRIYEFFRKSTIKKMGHIVGLRGDYEIAKKKYSVRGSYFSANYPQITLHSETVEAQNDFFYILIGNSGDSSNEHIKILEILEKYKDEKIRLFMPFSYGATDDYKEKVIEYGKAIFGDKLIPLNDLMTYDEYTDFLCSIDVMICFHNRQQALGNILQLLELGRKVFIREGITTASFLDENKIIYSVTDYIPNLNFEEFCYLSINDRENNHLILNNLYSDKGFCKSWNFLFQSIQTT